MNTASTNLPAIGDRYIFNRDEHPDAPGTTFHPVHYHEVVDLVKWYWGDGEWGVKFVTYVEEKQAGRWFYLRANEVNASMVKVN